MNAVLRTLHSLHSIADSLTFLDELNLRTFHVSRYFFISCKMPQAMRHLFLSLICFLVLVGCSEPEPQPPPEPRFQEQVLDDQIAIGYGLAIGHVDNDGKPDIILADKKEFVWYRNGDWQRFVIAKDLTARDNVAIAARDTDGDGMVEIAVGAMWNPGETNDQEQSGSVHYLVRPEDPTQTWEPIQLPHEPTTHRMHWVETSTGNFDLVVLPLHGRGNQGGEGDGVKVYAYTKPPNPYDEWKMTLIDESMHMTHNFDPVEENTTQLYIAGKEGIRVASYSEEGWQPAQQISGLSHGAGEVRRGSLTGNSLIAAIEPIHGTTLAAYLGNEMAEGASYLIMKVPVDFAYQRVILDSTFVQGHALATGDILGIGRDQIIAGWRNPNAENKVGIKMYVPLDASGREWRQHIIDDNTMAVEDLKLADLNDDGKLDIVAAGRATNNLKIYWNQLE